MQKSALSKRVAAALSVALVVSLGAAGTAWAYYTDTTKAAGMIQFKYDPNPPTTEVQETPDGASKIISVQNTGEVDAMVRVKVFDPEINGVELSFEPGDGWTQAVNENEEGWWYYTEPIAPGASTPDLKAVVEVDPAVTHGFDVIVVQQCATAKLFGTTTKDGNPVLGKFADGDKYLTSQNAREGE
ncbi:hypothetical protein [uncultured Adlercreutzia sp.]|uniref:hypothetical protein n=1 Tax=uncultured Adlercreutzia sp. TaxID=875803 RepID=UPI002676E2DA|nr:hypothetical protein [uncultured Adlercreutzia sp.]